MSKPIPSLIMLKIIDGACSGLIAVPGLQILFSSGNKSSSVSLFLKKNSLFKKIARRQMLHQMASWDSDSP